MDEGSDLGFFNGTVMRGEPNHSDLDGAEFVETATTAARYRLFSINDAYPAMIKADAGSTVNGELYRVPMRIWPRILESEPPGLYRGCVELNDGRVIFGMLGEIQLVEQMGTDITEHGGWKTYRATLTAGREHVDGMNERPNTQI